MAKKLPARPNLDHLRRQAKALLADLADGQAAAVNLLREHLPAARVLTPAQVRATVFKLADAQAAIARSTGFAGWPHLARHVEQLRALEGEWAFERLDVSGETLPAAALTGSRILIDGDRFRTESPEATYEGIFNLNVEAEPHEIDIEFVAGPEAGKTNHGIFRLQGDQLEIALDLMGGPRPREFKTAPGQAHAWEILRRASPQRPVDVKGGTPPPVAPVAAGSEPRAEDFAYVASPLLTRLQGDWSAVDVVRDGVKLPPMMLRTGVRSASRHAVKISFGGQTFIDALIKLDETVTPVAIDYFHVGGMTKGAVQHGILQWAGADACFCMGAPGDPRPDGFTAPKGSGRTYSRWRRKA